MTDREIYEPGDVIRNADGHPAAVLTVDEGGWPTVVLPASGDDGRRQVCPPLMFDRATNAVDVDRARRVAREEWTAGNRWVTSRKAQP